jgi:hypothetical protein
MGEMLAAGEAVFGELKNLIADSDGCRPPVPR